MRRRYNMIISLINENSQTLTRENMKNYILSCFKCLFAEAMNRQIKLEEGAFGAHPYM